MKEQLLPYFNERKTDVDMLVIHAFASKDFFQSCNNHQVSAHYFIDLDASITKVVDEKNRAWHTGNGFWRGIDTDLNSRSIGIEVKNITLGQSPFEEVQIDKLIHLCNKIIKKYNIKPENIVGHSDIAPERKPDPGLAFPWKRLAKEGIGLWYQIKNADKMPENDIAKLLSIIGYSTQNVEASAYAFCRRFLPEYVEKVEDVYKLVENVLPKSFNFMKQEKFLRTLKAVAYSYSKI